MVKRKNLMQGLPGRRCTQLRRLSPFFVLIHVFIRFFNYLSNRVVPGKHGITETHGNGWPGSAVQCISVGEMFLDPGNEDRAPGETGSRPGTRSRLDRGHDLIYRYRVAERPEMRRHARSGRAASDLLMVSSNALVPCWARILYHSLRRISSGMR